MAKLLAKHNVVFQVARDDCTTTTMSFDARGRIPYGDSALVRIILLSGSF